MQIPCSHLFAMILREGVTAKPILPETVDLVLSKSIEHIQLMKVVVRRHRPVPDERDVMGLKRLAWRPIKRFSHTREKERLEQYVDDRFVIGDTFALSIPMSILELISLGIDEFSRKR
jgi:hypothetical protein